MASALRAPSWPARRAYASASAPARPAARLCRCLHRCTPSSPHAAIWWVFWLSCAAALSVSAAHTASYRRGQALACWTASPASPADTRRTPARTLPTTACSTWPTCGWAASTTPAAPPSRACRRGQPPLLAGQLGNTTLAVQRCPEWRGRRRGLARPGAPRQTPPSTQPAPPRSPCPASQCATAFSWLLWFCYWGSCALDILDMRSGNAGKTVRACPGDRRAPVQGRACSMPSNGGSAAAPGRTGFGLLSLHVPTCPLPRHPRRSRCQRR